MNNAQDPNQLSSNRQAELRVWMFRNRLTYSEIGRRMDGITCSGVLRLVQGARMPVARHRQMLALGIPEELLPAPLDVPCGPRPRASSPTGGGV